MQRIRSLIILGAFALALMIGATQAADETLKASIIEAHDSLMSLPISKELTAEFTSDRATMIYRESDVWSTEARPVAIQFQGDVLVEAGQISLASNWVLFDWGDRSLIAAELSVALAGAKGSATYSCKAGQLFINGEATGTYPTDENPRLDLHPGVAVSCNGNRIHIVFITR